MKENVKKYFSNTNTLGELAVLS